MYICFNYCNNNNNNMKKKKPLYNNNIHFNRFQQQINVYSNFYSLFFVFVCLQKMEKNYHLFLYYRLNLNNIVKIKRMLKWK
jgi:hypothetical protein